MWQRLGIGGRLVLATAVVLLVAGVMLERLSSRELASILDAHAAPPAAIEAALDRSRQLVLVGVGAAILVAAIVGAAAVFLVTRPVRRLTRVALAMAEGNLSARAPDRGSGEVEQLAQALNQLTGKLSRSIRELRAERDVLAGILDGMREGVLVLDGGALIVLANRAVRGMVSVGEESVGKTVLEAFRNARLAEAVERAQNQGEPVDIEVELGHLFGLGRSTAFAIPAPRRILVRVSRLQGDGARPGVIAVFHDVTDLRRLETIRTDFVANVSHELRTPVTAISTAVETLQLGALSDPHDAPEFVAMIDRNARRLRQLVDDLLDLSKIESRTHKLDLQDLDVTSAVEHAEHLCAEPARRRRVTVTLDLPPELPLAHFDQRALEQVLTNLLDNAIKYAGEGAHVTISARVEERLVALTVADDGPGIPAQHLGRIFERFYRVDAGRSRDLGGTGLGLSIVKHLVELMNGTVDVESALGKGTRFTVRLPQAK
ncbi:HAMP domain-containing sensor histidine kinase [Chondromyces apiculatus]|uniref:histidine kinase n=1 Tax=Chondromyces apiculatus DSM 436 TaxID=1192034 RepID=A0A017T9C2_9BACT|nr:ATP-binding protein [Chondromyces apiculatus]EYF05415.1 Phosphate regulon sensor protein PhoR (SphS) [Chondromyces apiculatus DSM 436]